MIDWRAYLESICQRSDRWWDSYTITGVVGKNHDKQVAKSLLFDLQAIAIKPETQKLKREALPPARETQEILNVLEGLRKYAAEHVLLIGRPGSGKSTALVRSLLESAQNYLEINFYAHSEIPLKTTESFTASQFQLTSAMRQGIDSLKDLGENKQIPVLVELRYYETSILDLITAFLHRHDPSLAIDSDRVKELLRQGNFFLLIDGVNELPSQEAQRNLQKFRHDYQQTTPMIFTTRDLGVGGDLGIDKKLEMQPLTESQMGEFVRGYLGETGEQMLQQLGGRLREFGETPLLLMMLCSVFASNGNQIPANLGSVFRRFTEIYDRQIKQDIPVTDESRRWWKRLLQHLAWTMMGGNTTNIIQQGTGKVVFTSSTGNQSSWIRPDGKMSVFTYHLLEALQGAANQPGDKVVKVSHLMNHLSKTVPATARDLCKAEQTPFFSFETEDFPVALLCGGKGLATEGWDKQQAEETIRGIVNNLTVSNSDVGNIVNVIGGNNAFGDISSNKGK